MGYRVGVGVEVTVEARKNDTSVAEGAQGLMLMPSCSTLSLTVSAAGADAALDSNAPNDLTVVPMNDLAPDLAMSLDAGEDLASEDFASEDLAGQDLVSGDLNQADMAVTPTLAGTRGSSCTNIDLTTQGTIDWIHWGDSSGLNRKAGVPPAISVTQTGTLSTLGTGEPCTCSWSDGTPTISKSNSSSGQYMTGSNGFTITVPAGPTTRVLTIYTAQFNDNATLTAHLSDGSHADYVDSVTASGITGYVYTLTYATPNSGQTLTVTWSATVPTGQIGLLSTTLH